ncbi:MAG: BspA family leucine-rich repeat surface protein [Bacilli bacterium]
MSEETAQLIANASEENGYEVWLIDVYQQQTGETITPTYEFDNTKTYGSIEQLKDKDVKIYLEDYQGNVLLEPTKVSDISSDYVIYTKINSHDSTNENIKDKYKLRVWIDGEVDSSDWTATEKHEYKFKIGVKTKLKESDVSADENPETSDLKYTVKYNANGGKGTMKNSTFVYNQTGKLSKNTFTREHYTFKGWSTKPTSNQVVYNDEAEVKNLTDVYHGVVNLYAVWQPEIHTVNVVVQNGTVDTATKSIEYGQNGIFNLTSALSDSIPIVTCTNNQTGSITNNVLTVSNVTQDTTCTVKYVTEMTTLYIDGTLIINESLANRSSNITNHGAITNQYEPISDTQSYSFSSDSSVLWYDERESITEVEIGQKINPTNTAYWFYECRNMTTGDFTKLDTSSVTDMSFMFYYAGRSATTWSIGDLSSWDTSSVTDMSSMFEGVGHNATTWTIGDLSGWDTSSVTNMSYMFSSAGRSATTFNIGDLSGWNTSSVTNMSWMFENAGRSATTWSIGDLSSWNTSSVTNMSHMFDGVGNNATTWTIGDLSGWNTSSVTNMSYMFDWAGYMAKAFNIGDLSNWDTSQVTDMSFMFGKAGYNATTWTIGDLSGWNTSSVTNMSDMFNGAGRSAATWSIGDLSNWDTSQVTDMSYMFDWAGYNATTFNIGDLSGWNTSSVTNMSSMFDGAGYNATTFNIGDLSGWNTSSVTNMSAMFKGAGYSATWSLDCSSWNVNKVKSYGNFNYGVETKVTAPTWVN